MAYQSMGATSAGDWNSTKYPGVCKPTNFTALAIAKSLQSELNRLAQVQGLPKIAVDGDIGPSVIRLIQALKPYPFAPFLSQTGLTCSAVAMQAEAVTATAKAVADAASVPAKVSQPAPSKPITIITPAGQEVAAPASMQQSSIMGMGLGGLSPLMILVAGGFLFYTMHEGKKGKRSSARASSRRFSTRRSSRRSTRTGSKRRSSRRTAGGRRRRSRSGRRVTVSF